MEEKILTLKEVEKQHIIKVVEQLNGDKILAAMKLGIGKTTIYRKLREWGIE